MKLSLIYNDNLSYYTATQASLLDMVASYHDFNCKGHTFFHDYTTISKFSCVKNNSTCACVHRGRGQAVINIKKLEFSNLGF